MVYKWLHWSCTIVPFTGTLQEAAGRKTGFAQICSRKICKSGAKMVNATLAYLFKTSCIIVCKFGIYHLCPRVTAKFIHFCDTFAMRKFASPFFSSKHEKTKNDFTSHKQIIS